ncbi:MAG: EamA family transporter [Candidatus Nanopelagicales bacterium]|nr:EamA family transporter [Candidatus Nanopelagicales bacterium]
MGSPTIAVALPATRGRSTTWATGSAGMAMVFIQLGAALSIPLIGVLGPAGTTWVRTTWAALFLLILIRPKPWKMSRRHLRHAGVLGFVVGVQAVAFFFAISRLPMGTASAIEFLGPLGVAVVHGRGRQSMAWPLLAVVGVLALTRPWEGSVDLAGIAAAALAAACWAAYIVMTQKVGDELPGLTGLALYMPVAALVAGVIGMPQAIPHLTTTVLLQCAALAVITPLLPYAMEMIALRGLNASSFGVLMALEPALAALMGLAILGQALDVASVIGIAMVVAAGIGAQRGGARVIEAGPNQPLTEARVVAGNATN